MEVVGEQLTGGRSGCGSLMTARRKPAVVNASVIACNGLRQNLIGTDCPLNVQSKV
jgi:hypothetical protein